MLKVVWNIFKYVLAFGLLAWVIWVNWSPREIPGTDGKPPVHIPGLQDVYQKHFVQGQPIHLVALALATLAYGVSLIITLLRWYILVRAVGLPFTVTGALRFG